MKISAWTENDPLERACERIWIEIRSLLPRHRRLHELGPRRTAAEGVELAELTRRVAVLREETERYRQVLRAEAWARLLEGGE